VNNEKGTKGTRIWTEGEPEAALAEADTVQLPKASYLKLLHAQVSHANGPEDGHIRATGLDHTALCVKDMDATIALFEELLGTKVAHREVVTSQKVTAAFFDFPNGASLELVSPEPSLGGNAGLEKFLAKRGDGLHHLALRVENLDSLLQRLAARGVALIDPISRPGARGHKVAFLHPKVLNGTLLELVEAGH